MLEAFGIAERVAVLELDLAVVLDREPKPARGSRRAGTRRATSTWRSRCPTTCRPRSSTRRSARAPAALLVDLELFDVYRGAGVGDGRRSLAYRLRLQAPDRNLTDADVAEVRAKVTAATAKLGAELRG